VNTAPFSFAMPIRALFWQAHAEEENLKAKPSRVWQHVAFILWILVPMVMFRTILVLVVRENSNQMHPVPRSELFHTELTDEDFVSVDVAMRITSSSPPPPPFAPPPTTPSREMPFWLRESLLPPRPLKSGVNTNDTNPAHEWAYLVRDARPGTVLIGDHDFPVAPNVSMRNPVILLLRVCSCQPTIFGVVLNAGTDLSMSDAFCPPSAARYPAFLNNSIRSGGASGSHWTLLSRISSSGSSEVLPGLHAGGSLLELQRAAARGDVAAIDDVAFFHGFAAWPLSQLDAEIGKGLWTVARASAAVLFKSAEESEGERLQLAIRKALR